MWLLLLAGLAVGGLFTVDEAVHPEKYPEQSQIYGIHIPSSAPTAQEAPSSKGL